MIGGKWKGRWHVTWWQIGKPSQERTVSGYNEYLAVLAFRVRVVFRKTVESDWRFDYLCHSDFQSQTTNMLCMTHRLVSPCPTPTPSLPIDFLIPPFTGLNCDALIAPPQFGVIWVGYAMSFKSNWTYHSTRLTLVFTLYEVSFVHFGCTVRLAFLHLPAGPFRRGCKV